MSFLLISNSLDSPTKIDSEKTNTISEQISEFAIPLESEKDLDYLIENSENKDFVLLGESSHGTSEYYTWRAKITKRLITEKGFSFLAIEGDWPYIYNINRYVKMIDPVPPSAKEALFMGQRWPEWIWANEEFLELVEWLREYNMNLPANERIGVYGMDMQNPKESMNSAIEILNTVNPTLATEIGNEYECLMVYEEPLNEYAQAYSQEEAYCEEQVLRALELFEENYSEEEIFQSNELFNINQNILALVYAESYSRNMFFEGPNSWNARVWYFKETLENIAKKYGEGSKGVVWGHNTHVGDARESEMSNDGSINIGQLLREEYEKENILSVGFGTYEGEVVASGQWLGEERIVKVPPAMKGSVEDILNELEISVFMFFFDEKDLRDALLKSFGHRAKGVVYNPSDEVNRYVQTILPRRYDAFIFITETTALNPL